jgi:hypothetical protein
MRLGDGLRTVERAVAFLLTTLPGRLVALTVALCALASFYDMGVTYEARAFIGASLAVTASVVSELAFGALLGVGESFSAHWWRAFVRGLVAVGGALFTSGGLDALALSPFARVVMLLAIVWIAIGPVLADVIDAYAISGDPYAPRARDGAAALRAVLAAAAACGLALYGLAQLMPWWLPACPVALAGLAGCSVLQAARPSLAPRS